jgi:hypothetical protein
MIAPNQEIHGGAPKMVEKNMIITPTHKIPFLKYDCAPAEAEAAGRVIYCMNISPKGLKIVPFSYLKLFLGVNVWVINRKNGIVIIY